MKRLILTVAAAVALSISSYAQSYVIIDSEKIFTSVSAYNQAVEQIDELTALYQKNIDDAYNAIETQYNTYIAQREYLSASAREAKEAEIIGNEEKVTTYSEEVFGDNGELMRKRVELIKPIQDQIFEVINNYASANDLGMVLDISTTTSIIFYKKELDKSDEIIELLRENNNY